VYRGPSRGPCVVIIYTHPSRVGGIEQLLFSPVTFQVAFNLNGLWHILNFAS